MSSRKTPLTRDEWQAVADDLVAAHKLLTKVHDRLEKAMPLSRTAKLRSAIRKLGAVRSELCSVSGRQLNEDTFDWFYNRGCLCV
jgi:hypothetical protein